MRDSCEPRFVLQAALAAQAERGGNSVPGCAPFGLQRTVCTPRSIQARIGHRVQGPVVVRHGLQGEGSLSFTLGTANHLRLLQPRKPNPAFERTAHGKPWSTAQGERWVNSKSGPHAPAVSLSRRSRFARIARRQVRAGLLALPLAAIRLYAALYARSHSPLALGTGFCLPPSSRQTWFVGQGRRGKFLLPQFTT